MSKRPYGVSLEEIRPSRQQTVGSRQHEERRSSFPTMLAVIWG